jgi:thiamine biosynthesis lipoprotein
MSMPISLALRGRHCDDEPAREAWAAVMGHLRRVDRWYSPFRPDSYVSRLDDRTIGAEDCPDEVVEVLRLAQEATVRTDGYFSVRRPDATGRVRLDPSGLVKGWAVECAARALDPLEDTDFCLSAGGDLVCRTLDAGSEPWKVGIEDPLDPHRLVAVVPVRNGAVATSGSSRRGRHVVDPHTGQPPHAVASVTVVGRSLARVDVDATAAFARDGGAAGWLAAQGDVGGLVVWTSGRSTVVRPGGVGVVSAVTRG